MQGVDAVLGRLQKPRSLFDSSSRVVWSVVIPELLQQLANDCGQVFPRDRIDRLPTFKLPTLPFFHCSLLGRYDSTVPVYVQMDVQVPCRNQRAGIRRSRDDGQRCVTSDGTLHVPPPPNRGSQTWFAGWLAGRSTK